MPVRVVGTSLGQLSKEQPRGVLIEVERRDSWPINADSVILGSSGTCQQTRALAAIHWDSACSPVAKVNRTPAAAGRSLQELGHRPRYNVAFLWRLASGPSVPIATMIDVVMRDLGRQDESVARPIDRRALRRSTERRPGVWSADRTTRRTVM